MKVKHEFDISLGRDILIFYTDDNTKYISYQIPDPVDWDLIASCIEREFKRFKER